MIFEKYNAIVETMRLFALSFNRAQATMYIIINVFFLDANTEMVNKFNKPLTLDIDDRS
jgi:hypothetical protein